MDIPIVYSDPNLTHVGSVVTSKNERSYSGDVSDHTTDKENLLAMSHDGGLPQVHIYDPSNEELYPSVEIRNKLQVQRREYLEKNFSSYTEEQNILI
jgi:hypothetical protein